MQYNFNYLMLLFCLFQLPADCQQSEPKRIVYRSEAEQRRFVAFYLDQGVHIGRMTFDGMLMEPSEELVILTRLKPWVLPILEQRAVQLMEDPVNKELIDHIGQFIASSGNQAGLDTIVRVFGNSKDLAKWIRSFIYGSIDQPNYFTTWYSALDSTNQVVREEATRCMLKVTGFTLERGLHDWADAAVNRYHHAPTEEEILNDPIYGLPRSRDLKVEHIIKLKSVGEEEVERRKKGGKPGHPRAR